MNEVLTFCMCLIIWLPVTTNGQHVAGPFLNSHDVRQGDACLVTVLILVLVSLEVKVHVHLKQLKAVVRGGAEAHLLGNLLLNLVERVLRCAQVNVAVEPRHLQLAQLVLGLAHHVGNPWSRLQVTRAVWHYDVFSRDKVRHLTVHAGVEVHLLERIARQAQAPQHALVLRAVFLHHVRQLVVHVILDTQCGLFLGRGLFANDLGLDWTSGWKRGHHGLGLKLHQRLRQHGVVHAACAFPRLRALFDLHAQQLKAVHVSLHPVLAAGDVFIKVADQIAGQSLQRFLVDVLGQVGVEVVLRLRFRCDLNLHPIHADGHGLGVLDLDLNLRPH